MRLIWLAGLTLMLAYPAHSGPKEDILVQCMSRNVEEDDRVAIIRFLVAMYLHTEVGREIAVITPDDAKDIAFQFMVTTDSLLVSDCRQELRLAYETEGFDVLTRAVGRLTYSIMESELISGPLEDFMSEALSPDRAASFNHRLEQALTGN